MIVPQRYGTPRLQTIKAYTPSWAEERDKGLGLQMGERQFTEKGEEEMFGKQMFACPTGKLFLLIAVFLL